MTAGLLEQSTGPRCPSCSATVNLGAPWCTLCYADLRPAPAPTVAASLAVPPSASYGVPALDPLTAPAAELGLPTSTQIQATAPTARTAPTTTATWPCSTCGHGNDLSRAACASCGAGFLARLREDQEPLLVLPVVGDLSALSRGQRLGLAAGVVLAVLVLVMALGFLLG